MGPGPGLHPVHFRYGTIRCRASRSRRPGPAGGHDASMFKDFPRAPQISISIVVVMKCIYLHWTLFIYFSRTVRRGRSKRSSELARRPHWVVRTPGLGVVPDADRGGRRPCVCRGTWKKPRTLEALRAGLAQFQSDVKGRQHVGFGPATMAIFAADPLLPIRPPSPPCRLPGLEPSDGTSFASRSGMHARWAWGTEEVMLQIGPRTGLSVGSRCCRVRAVVFGAIRREPRPACTSFEPACRGTGSLQCSSRFRTATTGFPMRARVTRMGRSFPCFPTFGANRARPP